MSVYITRINGLPLADTVCCMQHMTADTAHRLGIREMGIYRYDSAAENNESLHARIDGIIAGINRGDLIICQFPTGNGLRFERALITHLKAYGGRIAVFLQDLEPLHYEEKGSALREVIDLYSQAEVLIVPSAAMRQYLLDNHMRKNMKFVVQEIWDYTVETAFSREPAFKKELMLTDGGSFEEMQELQMIRRIVGMNPDEAVDAVKAMSQAEYQEYVRCVRAFAPALRNRLYTERCLIEAMQAFCRKDAGSLSVPSRIYGLEHPVFAFTVLKESYGGGLALSWIYKGYTDGFLICDAAGKPVCRTDNIHQHYCLIKGYGTDSGFVVKAYANTLKGRMVIAESPLTLLDTGNYERPEVSLIIPAYNAQDYLSRSIDTALAQSFDNLEVIIVNDGSSDGTQMILDWYEKKYPNIVVIHQENGGTPAARNTGIRQAGGEYIGFMDNDDMIRPDMVARLYRSAKKNNCDMAITSVCQITDNGYEVFAQYPMEEDTAVSVEEFFEMHFTKGCMFAVVIWNKLYRAALVKSRLIPVMVADDNAWTPYILSYADQICYLDDHSYEWDRKIRSSTLVDKWQRRSNEELFQTHRDTILFYLEQGNPKRLRLLKQLAKRQLSELARVYSYEKKEQNL